ncbi:MAG: acetyltransferase [Proteobacteria bacterium]|nr:acetyltransferase [Pseudomonadota bacterium]
MTRDEKTPTPEAVRAACLIAARTAYEDAMQRGLCAEGALEAALGAIEMLNLETVQDTDQAES